MTTAQKSSRIPSIAVLLILANIGMSFISVKVIAETVPSFEFNVPPLRSDQPHLRSIRVWNGNIVVESVVYSNSTKRWKSRYYVADIMTNSLYALVIKGCKTIRSIAESAKVAFVFCNNDQQPVLLSAVKSAKNGWRTEQLPVGVNAEENHILVASDKYLALLSREDLYIRTSGESWQRSLLPGPRSEIVEGPPQHALLTNESLLLGFDWGEFGGGLIHVPIEAHSANQVGPSKLLSSMNVREILADSAGTVWVVGGLAHLDMKRADLVTVKDGSVKTIVNDESFSQKKESSSGSLQLPGATDVTGLCLDPTEKPLILATNLGIFQVGDDNLTYRIKASFDIPYEKPGYIVGNSPVGMACTADGSILVATSSTGILAFVKTVSGYDPRQMLFGD